jgi:hypothetical protein
MKIDEYRVPTEVNERGWQWRPVGDDTAFAPPFGTIRECRVCGCLVAGGPTRCTRCVPKSHGGRWRLAALMTAICAVAALATWLVLAVIHGGAL